MATDNQINWYRVTLDKATLKELTKRSDWKGLAQAVPHLLLVAATGVATWYAYGRLAWPWVLLAFFVHGTVIQFQGGVGAFHELCHGTPFKTHWLNEVFLWIASFLTWSNFMNFRASHTRHHLYTVHHSLDMEVVLPIRVRLADFLLSFVVNPIGVFGLFRTHARNSLGILEGEWQKRIFSEENAKKRIALANWARFLILGHLALAGLFIWLRAWIFIPIFLAPFYASWLTFLCGVPQHLGLRADVPDWRRSARTVLQDPITRFLYWRMNYHMEHHMYAAVPFHALGRLHRAIAHDTPKPNRGLLSAWKEIIMCARKQRDDPAWELDAFSRAG